MPSLVEEWLDPVRHLMLVKESFVWSRRSMQEARSASKP